MTRLVMHLLVVDDSRADFEITSRELERVRAFESDARHCADAASCLKVLGSEIVDCVLLDYRLGPVSGLDVLTALRGEGYDHAVIILTGQGDEQIAVEAMKRGAQDYLVKDSVTSAVLRRSIYNAVQKVRLVRSLREKQDELEGFVSVVAHDLQNPVCSALDSIQVIRDFYAGSPLDSRAMALIGGAITSLQRMSQLIDALLDYAWTGRDHVPLETVDLNLVAAEVAVDLRSAVESNRGRLDIGILPEVSGDPVAFRQILQNLIANALKFRGKADPVVSVICDERPDVWVLSVTDNGIGIAAEHLNNIFQPFCAFMRAANTTVPDLDWRLASASSLNMAGRSGWNRSPAAGPASVSPAPRWPLRLKPQGIPCRWSSGPANCGSEFQLAVDLHLAQIELALDV